MGLKSEAEYDRLTKCPENVGSERHLDGVLHVCAVCEENWVGMGPFLIKKKQDRFQTCFKDSTRTGYKCSGRKRAGPLARLNSAHRLIVDKVLGL